MTNDPLYQIDESQYCLCPQLYLKLRDTFAGGVIIANQGEPIQMSSPWASDGRRFTSIHHSGEYYRVNCPFCQDTRHRLWINHMYGQPDANGKPMRFLATCYNEDCLGNFENWKRLNDAIFGMRNRNDRRQPAFALNQAEWLDPNDIRPAEAPGQLIPVSQLARSMPGHPAVQYLCNDRRYSTHVLDHYNISFCSHAHPRFREAQGRAVFPIIMGGQMVGWQARYLGTADWHVIPKYYGLPGMKKRLMLYNYDNAIDKPFVVVVEGPTDVHVVGDHAVAILGKNMSRYQYLRILNTWPGKPVILILDPDAREEMRSTVADMRANDVVVVEVNLPDGFDCGDYDRRTIWNIIHSQAAQRGVILPR